MSAAVRAGMALILAVCVIGVAQARSVYRWVDRNGVVHYDDTNSGGQRMTREYLADRVIPDEPEWAGVIPGDLVAEVRQRCDNARERLANYRTASEIYGRDPSGNVYRLSVRQARLMVAELQAESDRYCRPDAAQREHADRIAQARAERARKALPSTRR